VTPFVQTDELKEEAEKIETNNIVAILESPSHE
jgi:hypothetical protein